MARGGRDKDRASPERRCVVTGQTAPRSDLVRFVVGPEDSVVPDVLEKLPGRGFWVSSEKSALKQSLDGKAFSRAARQKVDVPTTLVEDVERQLLTGLTGRLSVARKAGMAVAGFEKVKDWLAKEDVEILFQATDGSERGKSKLRAPRGNGRFFEVLTASELGLSFGRENVIHAALAASGLVEGIRRDAVRLAGVRESDGGKSAGKVK
ncbi:MAG: RNA-binding protein [Rhodobacteraceae bacterium]|nr:RNA-binding protein [Paracoccaceae bacterium]